LLRFPRSFSACARCDAIEDALRTRRRHARTVLFIDEIYPVNTAHQDTLLGAVEDGTISLVRATTENPSFEVSWALLSRCRVVVLDPLEPEEIATILRRALDDKERGLAGSIPDLAPE
jgi:putative ATPase